MPEDMSPLDLIIGVSLATGLTAYLVYALIRPEKF
jgi:K+-transporting ATPase KdpF subunit